MSEIEERIEMYEGRLQADKLQEKVALYKQLGMPYTEMARRLGLTVAAVRKASTGRQHLLAIRRSLIHWGA